MAAPMRREVLTYQLGAVHTWHLTDLRLADGHVSLQVKADFK